VVAQLPPAAADGASDLVVDAADVVTEQHQPPLPPVAAGDDGGDDGDDEMTDVDVVPAADEVERYV